MISIFAKDIVPYRYVTASEAVSDFVKAGDTLVIGTEEGILDIYDLKQDKLIDQVALPKYKNILDENMRSLILSVDYLNGRILFIGMVLDGYRELYLYENKKLTTLIDSSKKTTIQKVMFVDENTALIQSMGNEIVLFNIKTKEYIYKKQLNHSSFSDLALDEEKKYAYTGDETPTVYKIEVRTGVVSQEYNEANKRDIFSLDFKNKILLTGGKDRRVIAYKTPTDYKIAKGGFFIYSVSLNPKAELAAFVKNENSEISIVDTNNMDEKYLLKGHNQTIIKIDFYGEKELISADEDKKLMFWKLD